MLFIHGRIEDVACRAPVTKVEGAKQAAVDTHRHGSILHPDLVAPSLRVRKRIAAVALLMFPAALHTAVAHDATLRMPRVEVKYYVAILRVRPNAAGGYVTLAVAIIVLNIISLVGVHTRDPARVVPITALPVGLDSLALRERRADGLVAQLAHEQVQRGDAARSRDPQVIVLPQRPRQLNLCIKLVAPLTGRFNGFGPAARRQRLQCSGGAAEQAGLLLVG
mmetsp:Transcript_4859/g.14676  ORF Transcript_4859/g.14676 Transcript_4859/m.14676 type:complete len:222 (-) Transcript_4859:982-1647(-)